MELFAHFVRLAIRRVYLFHVEVVLVEAFHRAVRVLAPRDRLHSDQWRGRQAEPL